MGDIADMMIEGELCELCGVAMPDGQAPGYPRQCRDCKRAKPPAHTPLPKAACDICGRKVKGLADHKRDAHGIREFPKEAT